MHSGRWRVSDNRCQTIGGGGTRSGSRHLTRFATTCVHVTCIHDKRTHLLNGNSAGMAAERCLDFHSTRSLLIVLPPRHSAALHRLDPTRPCLLLGLPARTWWPRYCVWMSSAFCCCS